MKEFISWCLIFNETERPSADELLHSEFLNELVSEENNQPVSLTTKEFKDYLTTIITELTLYDNDNFNCKEMKKYNSGKFMRKAKKHFQDYIIRKKYKTSEISELSDSFKKKTLMGVKKSMFYDLEDEKNDNNFRINKSYSTGALPKVKDSNTKLEVIYIK